MHDGLLINGRRTCHGRRLQARAAARGLACWPSSASDSPSQWPRPQPRGLSPSTARSLRQAPISNSWRCSIGQGPMGPATRNRASPFQRTACRGCASSMTSMSAARSPPQTAGVSRLRPSASAIRRLASCCSRLKALTLHVAGHLRRDDLERPGRGRAHVEDAAETSRLALACPRQQSFLYEPEADRHCMPAKPPSSNGQDVRFST